MTLIESGPNHVGEGVRRAPEKFSMMISNVRNSIPVALGIPLSFALAFGGWRLSFLIVGPSSTAAPMDAVGWRAALWAYVVAPMVFIVLAAAVALIVARSLWWLGGVTLLPLLIYGLTRPGGIFFIPLFVAYIALAFAAALLASRLKPALSR